MCTEKIIIFLIISVGAALNPSQACGGGGRGGGILTTLAPYFIL